MVKFLLLSGLLAVVVCLAKADVSHVVTNGYLPPEQPKTFIYDTPAPHTSRESNFNFPSAPSISSTPPHHSQRNYQSLHAQIESIRPSIHIASFSVRTTVPFPQTYPQQQTPTSQQPTSPSETEQASTHSYDPQGHFPQIPAQQSHSPEVFTAQEYAPEEPVYQQHPYPGPVEIPPMSSRTEQQYPSQPPPINYYTNIPPQTSQQSYTTSSPVQQGYLPPTQLTYAPQVTQQQSYYPSSSTQQTYSPPEPPVAKQQDYSYPGQVQQTSFTPEVVQKTYSYQPNAQPSYQQQTVEQQTYTTSEPVQQTYEHQEPPQASFAPPPSKYEAFVPPPPQQHHTPSTNESPRASNVYPTSNTIQDSYEQLPNSYQNFQHQPRQQFQQQFTSSPNTQDTSKQPQQVYESNSSPIQVYEAPNSVEQIHSPPTYNYQPSSQTYQQQSYSPQQPERSQHSYLPPPPVKTMNPNQPTYSTPALEQKQSIHAHREYQNQVPYSPQQHSQPLEPVHRAPTVSSQGYPYTPIPPQQPSTSTRPPSPDPTPRFTSSYQSTYEVPVPSQLALSYEVSSSSPVVEPRTYKMSSTNVQAPTQHSQGTPKQSLASVQHRPSGQTLEETQSNNINQGSYNYKPDHPPRAPQTYESQSPREMFNFTPQTVAQPPVNSAQNTETKPTGGATSSSKETTKLTTVQPVQKSGPSLVPEPPRSSPSNVTQYSSNGGYIYRRQ